MGLFSKTEKTKIRVPEMSCKHCESRVTAALSQVPGVVDVKADSGSKIVTLSVDGKNRPGLDALSTALEGTGYTAGPEEQ